MSTLRARCPDCRTLTAVAIGTDYQCHSCGRELAAGLVRIPRAWGEGGEAMAAAAWLNLPYPEAAVVEEQTLEEQIEAQGRNLDPPELAYREAAGIDDDIDRALEGCDQVYVAFDCDVLRPGEIEVFMPEPGGSTLAEAETMLHGIVARRPLVGLGLTGLSDAADATVVARLAAAAGL